MQDQPRREQFSISGGLAPGGDFEILAITAGTGNGWEFTPDALRASLNLWDGVECFIDHAASGHSLRDLAGVYSQPRWDESAGGIRLSLHPCGPSGALLAELGQQLLQPSAVPHPKVGFSADVLFSAAGREVRAILRVFSVDLVVQPARGGAFLRVRNPEVEEQPMIEASSKNQSASSAAALEAERSQLAQPEPQTLLEQTRQQMCACLLDSALAASHLPAPALEQVRKQFRGRLFEPAELQSALDDARELVSALTAGAVVQGPGAGFCHVHGARPLAGRHGRSFRRAARPRAYPACHAAQQWHS